MEEAQAKFMFTGAEVKGLNRTQALDLVVEHLYKYLEGPIQQMHEDSGGCPRH